MQIFSTIAEVRAQTKRPPRVHVPTMGALHHGHLELIKVARARAGTAGEVAVSIFVNPLQFEPGSDFERYPRPEKVDEQLCETAGVDFVFRPSVKEMYPESPSIVVEETALSQRLEGASRPGHFRGVCTVVSKLFHILQPEMAVFGEKDFQQLVIMQRMVRDLNFPVEIVPVPTVREEDGLALSSRNQYLNPDERKQAAVLRAALLHGAEMARAGEKSSAVITAAMRQMIKVSALARVDYIELVSPNDLLPRATAEPRSVIALAVFFGRTRLIDNIRLT